MWSARRDVDLESECEAKRKRRNSMEGEDREVPASGPSTSGQDVEVGEKKEADKEEPMEEDSVYCLNISEDLIFSEDEQPSNNVQDDSEDNELTKPQFTLFGPRRNPLPVTLDEPDESLADHAAGVERMKNVCEFVQRIREERKQVDPFATLQKTVQQIRNGEILAWKNVFKGKDEELDTIEKVLAESKSCDTIAMEKILKDHVPSDSIDEMLADEMRRGGLLEGVPAEKVFKPASGSSSLDDFPCRRFYDEMRKENRKQAKKRRECTGRRGLTSDDAIVKELSAICGEDLVVLDEPEFVCSAEDVSFFHASKVPQEPWRDTDVPPTTTSEDASTSPPFLDFDTLLTQEQPDYDSDLRNQTYDVPHAAGGATTPRGTGDSGCCFKGASHLKRNLNLQEKSTFTAGIY